MTDQPEEPPTARSRPDPRPVRGVRRVVYIVLAGLCLGLAVLGVLLPGLPTTPFVLVSSYLLVRSSPRLNNALLRSWLFGPILRDWSARGGIRTGVRIGAIVMVTAVVGVSCLFSGLPPWALAVIGTLALVGILVILWLPAARP